MLRSQSLAVASPEPVASKFPVGEKEAHRIGALCPEREFHWMRECLNKSRRTRKSRRATGGRTNAENALWGAIYSDHVFCCDICGRMTQDIVLDRFRYHNLGRGTLSRVFLFRQLDMKRKRQGIIILKKKTDSDSKRDDNNNERYLRLEIIHECL